ESTPPLIAASTRIGLIAEPRCARSALRWATVTLIRSHARSSLAGVGQRLPVANGTAGRTGRSTLPTAGVSGATCPLHYRSDRVHDRVHIGRPGGVAERQPQ